MIEAPLTQHYTFTIERVYDAPRERVFHAWASVDEKKKWWGSPACTTLVREMDFRPGGVDRTKGQWDDGDTHEFRATYHDIRENERIVYDYDMHVNDRYISASLATVEFEDAAGKTRMKFTEHAVYLDGWPTPEDREEGTNFLLNNLGAYLERTKATV